MGVTIFGFGFKIMKSTSNSYCRPAGESTSVKSRIIL